MIGNGEVALALYTVLREGMLLFRFGTQFFYFSD
jgi:hypothetical protein